MTSNSETQTVRAIAFKNVRLALKELARPNQPVGYRALLLRSVEKHFYANGTATNDNVARTADAATRHEFDEYHFGLLFSSIYYELLRLQYIQPKPDPHHLNLDHFVLTALGQQWLSNQEPIPEDRDGYIRALTEYAPHIDPIVLQYVREALLTFDRDALFASAVMIGAASEKILYLLLDGLCAAVQDGGEKRKIEKAISERSLPKMYRVIGEMLARAKPGMPYAVHEEADRHLLSLQDSIRVQRNDAVHPQIGQVTRESLRLSLAAFPFACKKVYDLLTWLKANAI